MISFLFILFSFQVTFEKRRVFKKADGQWQHLQQKSPFEITVGTVVFKLI
jgi:hypothetical protein